MSYTWLRIGKGILHAGDSMWTDASAGSGAPCCSNSSGTVTVSDPDAGVRDWILASDTNEILLPVQLTSFSGLRDRFDVILQWRTASELNNAYFEVQRSQDGIDFIPLSHVAGHGTFFEPADYYYRDKSIGLIKSPFLYYRLKQVDYGGDFIYSIHQAVLME